MFLAAARGRAKSIINVNFWTTLTLECLSQSEIKMSLCFIITRRENDTIVQPMIIREYTTHVQAFYNQNFENIKCNQAGNSKVALAMINKTHATFNRAYIDLSSAQDIRTLSITAGAKNEFGRPL